MNASYFASNKFLISGDYTSWFVVGRRCRVDCLEDGIVFGTVLSSSYAAQVTTVTIKENALTEKVSSVLIGASSGNNGSLPVHTHLDDGQGGTITKYLRTDSPQNISAQHIFNPEALGAPFELGANATGQLVQGLNAEQVGGKTVADLLSLSAYSKTVVQESHGFSVGELLKLTGSGYERAQCDVNNHDVAGIVSSVTDASTFVIVSTGFVSLQGVIQGTTYYLSPTTAGAYTETKPSTPAEYGAKPVFIAISNTEIFFFNGTLQPITNAVIEFDNTDLVSDKLTWNHGLSDQFVAVNIFNDSNVKTAPASVSAPSIGTVILDFTGMTPLTGTWHAAAR